MSRRAPNPAAEKQAQNQATLKSLLKLEPNKVCADCKRNKHPRWASWNLGVFVCIRCSGIHRGMGTHISRVKSVDLDSWTDEQMASILSWGNARANKYWEAKLAAGHSPSESKIENFIRTKYELKRWVMDGPKPDPSTLDVDGDDDVPLNVVKEKQSIQRNQSLRTEPQTATRQIPGPPHADLIGGDDPVPARSTTVGALASNVPPKSEPAAPKSTSTKDSLLGLDFLGGGSAAPPRPASTTGVTSPGGQSRPDLKQSILSLYASAPRTQAPPQQGFGGMQSPPVHQQQSSMGGFNDAFSNLSMAGSSSPPPPADPFASLGSASSSKRMSQTTSGGGLGGLSGGSFFDSKPAQPTHQKQPSNSGWASFTTPSPVATAVAPKPSQPVQSTSSAMGDLFDLSSPVTTTSPPPQPNPNPPSQTNSVFNLSQPKPQPTQPTPPLQNPGGISSGFALSGSDVWGSNEWASTSPAPAPAQAPLAAPSLPVTSPSLSKPPANDFGWGSSATGGSFANTPIIPGSGGGFNPAPKVSGDEEFGGWAGSTGQSTNAGGGQSKPAGGFGGGDDDLFSNVWN